MLPITFISFAEVCVTYQRRIFNFSNRATLHEACQNHNFLLCILVPCMYEVLQLLLFGTKKINRGSFTLFLQNKQNTVFNFLNNLARMAVFSYTQPLEFGIFTSDLSTGILYTKARDFRICLIYVLEFRILKYCTFVYPLFKYWNFVYLST